MAMMTKNLLWSCAPIVRCASLALIADAPLQTAAAGLLTMAVGNFNSAVGSLDSRVLPAARKMNELGGGSEPIVDVALVEPTPRALASPEASLPFDDELPALPKRRNGQSH